MAFSHTRSAANTVDSSLPSGDTVKVGVGKNSDALDALITALNAGSLGSGDMVSTNNFSDVSDVSTALDNLSFTALGKAIASSANAAAARTSFGLGTSATYDVGSSAGEIAVLGAGGKFATSVIPDGGYLTAANDLSDLNDVSTALDNLSFTATGKAVASAANAAAGRTAFGLGTASTYDVGSGAGELVALASNGKLPALDGSDLTGIGGQVFVSKQTWTSSTTSNLAITGAGFQPDFVRLDLFSNYGGVSHGSGDATIRFCTYVRMSDSYGYSGTLLGSAIGPTSNPYGSNIDLVSFDSDGATFSRTQEGGVAATMTGIFTLYKNS